MTPQAWWRLLPGLDSSNAVATLSVSKPSKAVVALLIFAAGTAVSMALLSSAFGLAIAAGPLPRNFERLAPVLGVLAAAFGIWYAAGALGVVAYPF